MSRCSTLTKIARSRGRPKSRGEFAKDLARYRVNEVFGDKYAGEWPSSELELWYKLRSSRTQQVIAKVMLSPLPQLGSTKTWYWMP
jgi:hypothetical protein